MAKHTGIRKTPNGKFKARYFKGYDANGKRVYPARTFDTEKEAIRWRSEEVGAKNPGRQVEGRSLTVSVYLARWLETKKQTVRQITWGNYESSMRNYVEPYVGTIPLSRLSASHIETLQAKLFAQQLSSTTVLLMRSILSDALNKAVRLGLIRVNPISLTDAPKRTKYNRYPLTVEEAVRLLECCDRSRFGLPLRFALTTGLRPEEIMGLRWSDIELGARSAVRVTQVGQVVAGGGWRVEKPKTDSGERLIVFPAELGARLQEHRKQQLERKLKAGQFWQDNDLVFTGLIGQPISLSHLRDRFKELLVEAGLPRRVRLYDLRHAFVTFSLVAGVDVKTVSKEAGHANVSFTLQNYGSVIDEMHQSASDKREGLLKSRSRR